MKRWKRWPLFGLLVMAGLAGAFSGRRARAGAPAAKLVARTVPLGADGQVSIETTKGSIKVRPWQRDDVEVRARIEPDDSCASDATRAERVAATEVRIEPAGADVRIATDY